jgi:hypothetical protein
VAGLRSREALFATGTLVIGPGSDFDNRTFIDRGKRASRVRPAPKQDFSVRGPIWILAYARPVICIHVGARSSAPTLQYHDWQRKVLRQPYGPYRDKLGCCVDAELNCMHLHFRTTAISNRPSPLLQDAYDIMAIDARAYLLLPRSFGFLPSYSDNKSQGGRSIDHDAVF